MKYFNFITDLRRYRKKNEVRYIVRSSGNRCSIEEEQEKDEDKETVWAGIKRTISMDKDKRNDGKVTVV